MATGYRFVHVYPTPLAVTLAYQFFPNKVDEEDNKSSKGNKKSSVENFNYVVINWGASSSEVALVASEGKHFGSKLQLTGIRLLRCTSFASLFIFLVISFRSFLIYFIYVLGFQSLEQSGGNHITELLAQHCIADFVKQTALPVDFF